MLAWTSKMVSWNGELNSKLGSAKKIKSIVIPSDLIFFAKANHKTKRYDCDDGKPDFYNNFNIIKP